jgi:hypothetical protein
MEIGIEFVTNSLLSSEAVGQKVEQDFQLGVK